MSKQLALTHKFVKSIPEKLEERTLYISIDYATVVHKCCCGCGYEVVTPLSPTDWKLIFDGVSISLFPSIGNWGFPCRSHYWIENNTANWADQWSEAQIEAGRMYDRQLKQRYYGTGTQTTNDKPTTSAGQQSGRSHREGFWSWIVKWWSNL